MYPEQFFATVKKRIRREWVVCFVSTFVFGFIAHFYKFVNWLPNWDSIVFRYDAQDMAHLGRWFLGAACLPSTYYELPWLNSLLSMFYLALAAVCVCRMFRVRTSVAAALTGGLMAAFPTVTSTLTYCYVADGYCMALLFAVLSAMLIDEGGKKRLVAGGALMTSAATDFFPWGAVSLLTQGQVGYIQFTWRLLILATPMLALAGGYGLCEFGGKRQDAAAVAALSMAVICVMPIFSSEIQNPIYVEKGIIISPFMGRSFPEYTYSDTTDFLAIRKRSVEIDGDAEMADYEKRSTTITAQVSARAESRITFPLFDYDGFRATVDGREIAVERGSNNRVSVVLPAGTSGALKIWFAGKGWWRVGDAVSAATLIGLLFWMKKGEKKACRTH